MGDLSNSHEFSIDVIGNQSGDRITGKFVVKTALSHREQLRRDELRRMYLGGFNAAAPSPRADNQAMVFSEINVRIIGDKGAPNFWKDADMGMDLVDDNVVAAVYDEVMKGVEARQKAVADAIAAARKDLRAAVAEADVKP